MGGHNYGYPNGTVTDGCWPILSTLGNSAYCDPMVLPLLFYGPRISHSY
jgi:hypothetical protein